MGSARGRSRRFEGVPRQGAGVLTLVLVMAHSDISGTEFVTASLAVLLGALMAVFTAVLLRLRLARDRPIGRSAALTALGGWLVVAVLFAVSLLS